MLSKDRRINNESDSECVFFKCLQKPLNVSVWGGWVIKKDNIIDLHLLHQQQHVTNIAWKPWKDLMTYCLLCVSEYLWTQLVKNKTRPWMYVIRAHHADSCFMTGTRTPPCGRGMKWQQCCLLQSVRNPQRP